MVHLKLLLGERIKVDELNSYSEPANAILIQYM